MDYIPHTPQEVQTMLHVLGLNDVSGLFEMIPEPLKNKDIDFPSALSEMEISEFMQYASEQNTGSSMASFLGGGSYNHFIPYAVSALVSRADFATAYTPYQPEASQGTLQAIFEFQTLMCRLT